MAVQVRGEAAVLETTNYNQVTGRSRDCINSIKQHDV